MMRKGERPWLLDLFCGAGGAGEGYRRAGFHVVGVDIVKQKHNPHEFYQDDALRVLDVLIAGEEWNGYRLADFQVIHASPPCEFATQMSARYRGKGGKADSHPDLLTPTLERLKKVPTPWVVENVPGARRFMQPTIVLHGGMFGLGVYRPRLFQSNVLLLGFRARMTTEPIGVYGEKPDGRIVWRNNGHYKGKSIIRVARTIEQARAVMGIDWMDWQEIRKAIPPAYTQWIGAQLMAVIDQEAA